MTKKLIIHHFTDPMSIYAYAMEPALRKVKYLQPDLIEIDNIIGLLHTNLEDFLGDGEKYHKRFEEIRSQMIIQCKDIKQRTGMPFSLKHLENLIVDDLDSTDLGLAYYSIKLIDKEIADKFLRKMMEDIHTYNLELHDEKTLENQVLKFNIDLDKFRENIENGLAEEELKNAIAKADNEEIFSFPSLFMEYEGKFKLITGYVDYLRFELEIENLTKGLIDLEEKEFNLQNLKEYISTYKKVTAAEVKLAFSVSDNQLDEMINELLEDGNYELEFVASSFFIIEK